VFATTRRKNRSNKMKSELGQSVDHFKRAASLAAQETSATVGPRYNAARDRVQPTAVKAKDAATSGWDSAVATLTPLVTAATEKAQQVSKSTVKVSKKDLKANKKQAAKLQKRTNKALGRQQKSRTGSKLGVLLLAGAAVGAVGAFVVRKRRQEQWDEYDPTPVTSPSSSLSGFAPTGKSDTASGAVASDPADPDVDPTVGAGTTTTDTVVTAEPAIELVDADTVDQTASAQHSPTVARLASGQNKS
jgi:hypothetical protein